MIAAPEAVLVHETSSADASRNRLESTRTRVIGPNRHLLAMENRFYRTPHDESDESCRNKGEMPTPTRVVFEICLALAGFLCVALIAQLVEIAIETL
jgi:hypothetical protein